jgi:hypothetical protein
MKTKHRQAASNKAQMTATLKPTLTPARLSVLKNVRDHPGHWASGFGVAVNQCWKLGWIDAAKNIQGQMIGHQITDAGRAILSAHELSHIRKPQPAASMQRSGIEGATHG